jgi:hypothetical protein
MLRLRGSAQKSGSAENGFSFRERCDATARPGFAGGPPPSRLNHQPGGGRTAGLPGPGNGPAAPRLPSVG